jgi:D-galactarolactone cycloisomerase
MLELLGDFGSELPIICIGGYHAEARTLRDLAKEVLRASGMGGCKVKVDGLSLERDAEHGAGVVCIARDEAQFDITR